MRWFTTYARQRSQLVIVATVLATVATIDQVTKWWAWRHVSGALINAGGSPMTGPIVNHWYENPFRGAILDLLGSGLLGLALLLLLRHRRHPAVLVSATVMLGGWTSNIFDRLGLHFWTAPGSVRGAVDFIHFGHMRYNVADICIVVGTFLFVVSVAYSAFRRRGRNRQAQARFRAPGLPGRVALAAVGGLLLVSVAVGAVRDDGVKKPDAPPQHSVTTDRT